MKELTKEMIQARKSKIQSWIDDVSRKLNDMDEFFKLAESLQLIEDGMYISGIPKGTDTDINKFYLLEDKLNYPKPQKV